MIAFTPHTGKVTALGFSPDGTRIVSASSDGALKLWDVASLGAGPPVWELENEGGWPINHCQFSWDGKLVYTGDTGGLLKAWDAADGRLRAATDPVTYPDAESASVNAFGLSLCGKFVAYGGGVMWLPTEFIVARASDLVPVRRVPGHRGAVGVFVPQAKGFISGSADRTVRLWDWDSATCHGTITLRGVVRGLAGSRDGRHVAVAGGALVHHYAATPVGSGGGDPAKVGDFRGHTKRVNCIEFSPDGARLASASQDGTVRVWDAATRAELRAFHPRLGPLHWVTFAPDGLTAAYSSERGHVGVFDVDG
jgi:WD40 repeat protein